MAAWPVPDAQGTVLLFPGRTEYVEKYGRTAGELAARGLATLAVDWRGQGLADRLLDIPEPGHVGQFLDYQHDVAAMLQAARALDMPKPWFLLAHSMGGAIGLRALIEGLPVAAAAFTGPMWGIRIAALMRPAAWALSWGSSIVGLGHRIAPGTGPVSYVATAGFEDNTLTTDVGMFRYMQDQVRRRPELQLAGPSLHWLREALAECRALTRLPAPPLPCTAFVGTRERIVDLQRIEQRMKGWPGGRLEWLEGAEHEVLMERPPIRGRVLDRLAEHFLARAPAREPA
ncbi:MAG: alpha/beta fold hydrolase [Paracoccaceae bacterium]